MKSKTSATKTKGIRSWLESMKKHSHSRTRLLDYHDSAANVTNSAFYSNRVTTNGPVVTSKQKHPVVL